MKRNLATILAIMIVAMLIGLVSTACHRDLKADTEVPQVRDVEMQNENETPITNEISIEDTFQEQVIIDNDICYFALTDYDPQNSLGMGFHAVVKNRSDHTLILSTSTTAVNRCLCHTVWSGQELGEYYLIAEKGETVRTFLYFTQDALSVYGINSVNTVELGFYLSETDDGQELANYYFEDICIALHQSDDTSLSVNDAEIILAQNDQFSVRTSTFEPETNSLTFLYENRTDKPLAFLLFQINGDVMDTLCEQWVRPGQRLFIKTDMDNISLLENFMSSGKLDLTMEVRELEFIEENSVGCYVEGNVIYSDTVRISG